MIISNTNLINDNVNIYSLIEFDRFGIKEYSFSSNFISYSEYEKALDIDFYWSYTNSIVSGSYKLSNMFYQIVSKYNNIDNFIEGIARVRYSNFKYGFIDRNGKRITKLLYDNAHNCNNGFIQVEKDGKWGFIDYTGKVVINTIYDYLDGISKEGMSIVLTNKKKGLINKKGKLIIPILFDNIVYLTNGIYQVFNKNNNIFAKEYNYGFIDSKSGKLLSDTIYGNGFDNSFLIFKTNSILEAIRVNNKNKYGMINSLGNEILPVKYDEFTYINNELLGVKFNNLFGLISYNGKILTDTKYQSIERFDDDKLLVRYKDKYGFISFNGKELIPPIYDSFGYWFSHGYIEAKINNKCGVLNSKGKEVLPFKYDAVSILDKDVFSILINKKWGIVDIKGKEITKPMYDQIGSLSDGLITVMSNNKWGAISIKGKQIIPLKYYTIGSFCEGMALVGLNGKYGSVNSNGLINVPIIYDGFLNLPTWSFHNGVAVAEANGKYCFIRNDGTKVTNIMFDIIDWFEDRPNEYLVELNGKHGLYSLDGRCIFEAKYDEFIGFNNNGIAKVKCNGKYGLYDSNGNEVIMVKYDNLSDFNKYGLAEFQFNGKYGLIDNIGNEIISFDKFTIVNDNIYMIWSSGKWAYMNKNTGKIISVWNYPNKYENEDY